MGIVSGTHVMLNEHNLYTSADASRRKKTLSGDYVVLTGEVSNSRVEVYDPAEEPGDGAQYTSVGWINAEGLEEYVITPEEVKDEEVTSDKTEEATEDPKEESHQEVKNDDDEESPQEVKKDEEEDTTPSDNATFKIGDRVRLVPTAAQWSNGNVIPSWVKMRTLYIRSEATDTVQVSTRLTGPLTGIVFTGDLYKMD